MHLARLPRVVSRGNGNFATKRSVLHARICSVWIGNAYFSTDTSTQLVRLRKSTKIGSPTGKTRVVDAGLLSKGETAKTLKDLESIFTKLVRQRKVEESKAKAEAIETAPAEAVDLSELRNILDNLAQEYLPDSKDRSKWYSAENMPEIRARLRQLTERKILSHFSGSFINLLKAVYPEHEWQEWRFSTTNVPAGFWDDLDNQKRFFDSLAKEHQLTSLDDFYRLSTKDVEGFGGGGLLASKYKNSFVTALETVYPSHLWLGWKFSFVPSGYWDDKMNRKKFFEYAITQVGASFDREDSLRRLSIKEINRLGGGWMLQKFYGNSVSNAMGDLFPAQRAFMPPTKEEVAELAALEHERRVRASEIAERRKKYEEFRKVLAFFIGYGDPGAPRAFHKLYDASSADIEAAGGRELLRTFGGSIFRAVKELFPEHQWLGWKFSRAPINFWKDPSNHRAFFEYLVKKSSGDTLLEENLYDLTPEIVHQEGGASMLAEYYSGRLDSAIQANFPEFSDTLKLWRFSFNTFSRPHWAAVASSSNKAWMQMQVKSFLEHMSQHPNLSLFSVRDWSRVSHAQIVSTRLTALVKAFGSLEAALRVAYPEFDWVDVKSHKASTQRLLFDIIRKLLPTHRDQIQESVTLADKFEVDIFIPELNLAFEYQGEQHFIDIRRSGDSEKARGIDASKAAELKRLSISLIEVKHLRAGKIDVSELIQAIQAARPDVKLAEIGETETPPQSASVRAFFDSAAQSLGLINPDDWYGVTAKQIKDMEGGISIMKRFGNSLRRALQAAFPEKEWLEWKFNRVPAGFWSDRKNRQRFFFYIMKKMNPEKDLDLSDLYYLPTERIIAEGGGGLLANEYSGSFVKCLKDTFPEHEWLEWRFAVVPLNFWSERENRVRFLEWVRTYLDLKSLDGFYTLSRDQWDQVGGASLMKYRSRLDVLRDAFPNHRWLPWKFDHASPSDWKDRGMQRAFLEWVLSQRTTTATTVNSPANAVALEDQLKTLTKDEIDRLGGSALLLSHGNNIAKLVHSAFPEIFWPEDGARTQTQAQSKGC